MSLKLPIRQQFSSPTPADAIDNSSIVSSRTINAKLPLWTAVVQFLPVKTLVCVYIDLALPKLPILQTIGFFCQTPTPVLLDCNFYNGNWTLKRLLVLYPNVQYFCCVGMKVWHSTNNIWCNDVSNTRIQENCQRYLHMRQKLIQWADFFIRIKWFKIKFT